MAILSVAAVVLAGLAFALSRPVELNYDTAYALVWGGELTHGHGIDYRAIGSPTPHPLLLVVGALASVFGSGAFDLLTVLGCLSWAALGVAVFALGSALHSARAGLVGALLALTSGFVLILGVTASKDVPFAALVVFAVALATRSPRRGMPVLVLLAFAGLIRPEAWVLSGFYAAYLWRAAPSLRAPATVVAASAPLIWLLSDLVVTGDPLFSLTYTHEIAVDQNWPRGLPEALAQVVRAPTEATFSWFVAAGGVAAAAAGLLRDPRSWLPTVAAGAALVSAFLVQGAAKLPLSERMLLPVSALVAAAFGAAVVEAAAAVAVRWRLLAVIGAGAAVAIALILQMGHVRSDRRLVRSQGQRQSALLALARTASARDAFARCPHVAVDPIRGPAVALPYLVYVRYDSKPGRVVWTGSAAAAPPSLVLVPPTSDATAAGGAEVAARGGWSLRATRC